MPAAAAAGIAHLVEDDDDYETASEGGSPTKAGQEQGGGGGVVDGGHLTASAPASRRGSLRADASRRQSRQGGAAAQRPDGLEAGGEGEGEEEGSADGQQRGVWDVLGGVPFLPRVLELLSPRATSSGGEEEGGEGEAGGEQPTSPGGTSRYPAVAAGEEQRPRADDEDLQGTTTDPAPLAPGQQPLPAMSEPSGLLGEDHVRALAAAVPARYRQARWTLLYATSRDGISLQTMLRNAARKAPTVLVVRDFQRRVFGAYCSEAWRTDKRFFGTGESFVFRLHPEPAAWYWWWRRMAREPNDYFQWCSPEAVAVGGSGGYALWLDADLASGLSRTSTTFGNACLAGSEEFRVGAVELWGLS